MILMNRKKRRRDRLRVGFEVWDNGLTWNRDGWNYHFNKLTLIKKFKSCNLELEIW